MEETLLIVRTVEELQRVIDYVSLPDFEFVAYDTETTGVEKDSEIVGLSICAEEEIGIYVITAEWICEPIERACSLCDGTPPVQKYNKNGTPKKAPKPCKECEGAGIVSTMQGELVRHPELNEKLQELLAILKAKSLVMHNSPYDRERTEFCYKTLLPIHTDTMELWHVLDENSPVGLKQIGTRLFGGDATKEQAEMKASVLARGGQWREGKDSIKEMYKADPELLGRYGAKDAILTLKIFYEGVERLYAEGLQDFFYKDESMPLMRGPTYDLNTVGLRLDVPGIKALEKTLADECARLKLEIAEAIAPHVKEQYPGTNAKNTFNINSTQQLSWLLFVKLGNEFKKLTDGGRAMAKQVIGKLPYSNRDKRNFIQAVTDAGKNPAKYMQCDKATLFDLSRRYEWVAKLLQYKSSGTILKTYAKGIQNKVRYGIISPSFLQHGTTSGRYSSRGPNFQNLPRDDKRIKACILSRPGRVFVGADYSQLEPRVFASVSQDKRLMECFAKGEDFYSVVGIPIFKKFGCSAFKKDANYFGADPTPSDPKSVKLWPKRMYPELRQNSKTIALATPYGQSAFQQAEKLKDEEGNNITSSEAQSIIDAYFEAYPSVLAMMLESHEIVKRDGVVYSLYGRPRRIPEAKSIKRVYGDLPHDELPYQARTLLNLAMNHRVQSTGASIVNRAAIAFHEKMLALGLDAKIVLQVHDEIVVECREEDKEIVVRELKYAMENTVELPGVALVAEPKVANNLAELK